MDGSRKAFGASQGVFVFGKAWREGVRCGAHVMNASQTSTSTSSVSWAPAKARSGVRWRHRLGFQAARQRSRDRAPAGKTIAEIFAQDGEPAFRAMERAFIEQRASRRSGRVVACGGGLVVQPGMLAACCAQGRGRLPARLAGNDAGAHRPPAQPAAARTWRIRRSASARSIAAREPIYRRSGTVILTDSRPLSDIVAHVMRAWRRDAADFVRAGQLMDAWTPAAGNRMHLRRAADRARLRRRALCRVGAGAGSTPLRDLARAGHARRHGLDGAHGGQAPRAHLVLPGARSIIMLGVNYWSGVGCAGRDAGRQGPTWARYALHEDYHDTMKPGLVGGGAGAGGAATGVRRRDYRYYVDTGPVLERSWAARAGLGFHRQERDADFAAARQLAVSRGDPDARRTRAGRTRAGAARPVSRDVGLLCGKCTRCLDACPTAAFAAPGVVDARRCVSYQTIENKGVIPRELRAGIGRRGSTAATCAWRFARGTASRRRAGSCC
jgi:shikimate kinase/ferredoxin